jgi:hypothetical protein
MVPGAYTITYSVSVSGAGGLNGTSASVQRLVVVLTTCAPGLQQCSDGTCAPECFKASILSSTSTNLQSSLSFSSNFTTAPVAPTVSPQETILIIPTTRSPPNLTLAPGLPSPVLIPKGWVYARCVADQVPTPSQPCETGAYASDLVDGPAIQAWILMCPPSTCNANGGCSGDRVIVKQPSACGIDAANQDIGTTLTLSFVVFNSAGLSSTVQRVLQIVSPCNATQFYCNGECINVDCAVQASIRAPDSAPSPLGSLAAGSPTLVLLPYRSFDSSTPWDLSGKNQSIYLQWGVAAPFSLAPCSSWAAANLTSNPSCAAAAYDGQEGDVSSFIEVSNVWSDQASPCTVASITFGSCLPGQYTMQYQVKGSQALGGQITQAYLNIFIEERISANFSFTFVPDNSHDQASVSLLSRQLTTSATISWGIAFK